MTHLLLPTNATHAACHRRHTAVSSFSRFIHTSARHDCTHLCVYEHARPAGTQPSTTTTTTRTKPPLFHAICPVGYSLEEHSGALHTLSEAAMHGDVCRGADKSFVCPSCCRSVETSPYCASGTTGTDPCRADAQFASCFAPSTNAPPLNCPTGFSPLQLIETAKGVATPDSGVSVCTNVTQPREWVCPKGWKTMLDPPYCEPENARAFPTKQSLAAVLRTWRDDAELGMYAVSSLVKVVPTDRYDFEIVIITDNASSDAVKSHFDSAKKRG
jgi:hypothetical protein